MNELKLFVIVRNDLSRSQKTVQTLHAGAEYILNNPQTPWDNGTVVCLKVDNEDQLKEEIKRLDKMEIKHSIFKEPDIGNEITSLAIVSKDSIFSHLKLL